MNSTKKGRKRQGQGSSQPGRVGTNINFAEMPEEELQAIVKGAKFVHAQPAEKTEFRRAYEERGEFHLHRRLEREEAQARKRAQKYRVPANRMATNATSPAPGSATIQVNWGYETRSITLTARNWRRVKAGKPLHIRGKGYHYEGQFFWDYWYFGGGMDGELTVTYEDGIAEGWSGDLSSADIEEHT